MTGDELKENLTGKIAKKRGRPAGVKNQEVAISEKQNQGQTPPEIAMSGSTVVIKPQQILEPIITAEQIKQYFCPKATNDELFIALNILKQWGLNPFKREVYFVKYDDKNPMQIVIGYETYLRNAERSGKWSGMKVWTEGEGKTLKACCNIYRNDWKEPFYHEVYFVEYCQYRKDYQTGQTVPTKFWREKPLTMLKKVVVEQGLRFSFPEHCGGLPYGQEELPIEPMEVTKGNGKQTVQIPDIIPNQATPPPTALASKPETAKTSDKAPETGKEPPKQEKGAKEPFEQAFGYAPDSENPFIDKQQALDLNSAMRMYNVKPAEMVAKVKAFYKLPEDTVVQFSMIGKSEFKYFMDWIIKGD